MDRTKGETASLGERVALRGLGWIEAHREDFRMAADAPGREALVDLKAIGELARLGSVLMRQPRAPAPVRARARALLDHGWTAVEQGEAFHRLLHERPELLMAGGLYSIFDRHGLRHAGVRATLAELGLRPRRPPARAELSPPRIQLGGDSAAVLALGLAEGWAAMGLPSIWRVDGLLPRTLLGQRPGGALDVAAGYSVAHGVYFVTEFGHRPEGLDDGSRRWLAARGDSVLDTYLDLPNLDIAAEWAFALLCAGAPCGRCQRFLSVVDQAQRDDGSLQAPVSATRPEAHGERGTAAVFRRDYHTTLAATLAASAMVWGRPFEEDRPH